MEGPINLEVLDPPDVEQVEAGPDYKRWNSNIVDIINANFALLDNTFELFISSAGIDVGGGGAGPITVTVTGLTTSGFVNVNLISTSNPNISIVNVVPGLNSFTITFNADPGASAIIVYQAYIAQPT